MKRIFLLFLAIGLMTSCSKDSNVETEKENNQIINLSGHVEKGPFVRGAIITAYELTKNLTATGKTFKSELINNIGEFSFSNIESNAEYLELNANGYYYNENLGQLSNSTITLNAIISSKSNSNISVNVLTHLEQKRVKYLLNQGASFTNAKNQARKELFDAFFITGINNDVNSEQITLTKNGKSSTALLAVSSLLLQLAGNNDAKLTELLSNLSNDLEQDGKFDHEMSDKIALEIALLDNATVNSNIKQRMAESGIVLSDFNFTEVFDQNLINRIQSINIETKELILIKNEKLQLVYSIFPINASNKNITWKSSNSQIVSVSSIGELTGLASGDATIIVESVSKPSVTTSIKIRVLDNLGLEISKKDNESSYSVTGGFYNGKMVLNLSISEFYSFFTNDVDKNAHSIIWYKGETRVNNEIVKTINLTDISFPKIPGASITVDLGNYYKPSLYFYYKFRGKEYVQVFSNF